MTEELIDELSSASYDWGRPNERTPFVDAALVRVNRALDAAASAQLGGRRRRRRVVQVESDQESVLAFELAGDGGWRFVEGTWRADGREQSSRLLRPTLRGIARAARPRHSRTLTTVTRDVDLVCARLIAELGGKLASAAPATRAPSPDSALSRAFGLSRDDRRALRAAGSVADLGAGTTLILAGTRGRDLLFLLDGVVAVELDGTEVRLGPGSVVGEQALLTGNPRSATVRATTEVLVLVVPDDALDGLPVGVRGVLGRKVPA